MINKRRAIPLIVVIFLVCIVLALGLYHVFTSFDIKRSEDIVGAINVTTTGSSENIPLATSNNGDFSGIFFQEAEYNKLIILKKNWMTGRYSCWGTASTLSTVGTYQSVDSHNRIVVVYGNNSDIRHKGFHIKKVARFTGNLFYGFLLSELFRQLGFVAHTIRGSSSSKISKCLDEGSNCRPQVHHFTRSFPEIWKLSS